MLHAVISNCNRDPGFWTAVCMPGDVQSALNNIGLDDDWMAASRDHVMAGAPATNENNRRSVAAAAIPPDTTPHRHGYQLLRCVASIC